MIQAVLFDLDGVICDTAELHYLAWKKIANKLGADISCEFNEKLKGVDRQTSLARILDTIDVKVSNSDFENLMELKNNYYINSLTSLTNKNVLPQIEQLMIELKSRNIKIAIASASKNAPLILEKIGIQQYVNTIANPTKIKKNKPAPDIFLLAASQCNAKIENCIGIEDAQAGIDALNQAKIKSIGIGKNLSSASIKLSTTNELSIDLILDLFNK